MARARYKGDPGNITLITRQRAVTRFVIIARVTSKGGKVMIDNLDDFLFWTGCDN
jgi:hypothetical protein